MAGRRFALSTLVLLAGALGAVPAAHAQRRSGDGFLFQRPAATLTLHGGYARASAGSDVFSFTTEQLTLGKGDFSGFAGGAELGITLASRVDLTLGADYMGRVAHSEFRDWVDNDDLPIEQSTRFERVPVTAGVRAYVLPRGRSVGRFAWVPARVAPYVGVTGGAMWYRFQQSGDFVDFDTPDKEIFTDVLRSSGWAPTAQGVAGAEFTLTPRLALNGEARYTWARAKMSRAFVDFDRIDLSGLSATVGLSLRL